MTNREFFIKQMSAELPAFERVLKAVNQKKWSYKPDEKSRTGQALASLIAMEAMMIPAIIGKGVIDMGAGTGEPKPLKTTAEMITMLKKGFAASKKAAEKISDKDWDTGEAIMKGSFGEWKDKRGGMAFGFLMDLIHHRGQLSTYLRPMGGKVPSIYGPSADSKPM